jgi:hypothetical protein
MRFSVDLFEYLQSLDFAQITSFFSFLKFTWNLAQVLASDPVFIWASIIVSMVYIRAYVKNEKRITKIENDEEAKQVKTIEKRIISLLELVQSNLYENVETYIYRNFSHGQKRIRIIRESSSMLMTGDKYLSVYWRSTRAKINLAYIEEVISVYRVGEMKQSDDDIDSASQEIFDKMFFQFHRIAGSNEELKAVEVKAVDYQHIRDMWISIVKCVETAKQRKTVEVKKAIQEYRMPVLPYKFKLSYFKFDKKA